MVGRITKVGPLDPKWQAIGKLSKKDLSGKEPTTSLHKKIQELCPDVSSITEVGVSKATNKYMEEQLYKLLDKKGWTKAQAQMAIGMEMLNYSPCDVRGAEDFVLYRRKSE